MVAQVTVKQVVNMKKVGRPLSAGVAPEMQEVLNALHLETLKELSEFLGCPKSNVYHWNEQLLYSSTENCKVEVPLKLWLQVLSKQQQRQRTAHAS